MDILKLNGHYDYIIKDQTATVARKGDFNENGTMKKGKKNVAKFTFGVSHNGKKAAFVELRKGTKSATKAQIINALKDKKGDFKRQVVYIAH